MKATAFKFLRKAVKKMAQKVTKFEYGRAYKSEESFALREENVVVRRTENSVVFKPLNGMIGDPMYFRRKVKVVKLYDGRKVECCKAQKRANGRIFASELVEDYIDPNIKEPEVIVTKKPEESDLPHYSEEQLIALSGAKKFAEKRTHNQYAYKKFGGKKNENRRS